MEQMETTQTMGWLSWLQKVILTLSWLLKIKYTITKQNKQSFSPHHQNSISQKTPIIKKIKQNNIFKTDELRGIQLITVAQHMQLVKREDRCLRFSLPFDEVVGVASLACEANRFLVEF